jgi:hypothetical protein
MVLVVFSISILAAPTLGIDSTAISINTDIDQKQEENNTSAFFYGDIWLAQSFTPTPWALTAVGLKLAKLNDPGTNVIVGIRENLTDSDDETTGSVPSDEISSAGGWITFDLSTTKGLNAGRTYYIVVRTEGGSIANHYKWALFKSKTEDKYPGGRMYTSFNAGGNWSAGNKYYDFCFRTIGFTNDPPDSPSIVGPSKATAGESCSYSFTSTDPEGQNVYYYIKWGEGSNNGDWDGPHPSGYTLSSNHTWGTMGTYAVKVKAKDTYGSESDWSTLVVSIPKNHSFKEWLVHVIVSWLNNILDASML